MNSTDTLSTIRGLINEKGWTKYRVAKEAGVSTSTLRDVDSINYAPSFKTLNKLEDFVKNHTDVKV